MKLNKNTVLYSFILLLLVVIYLFGRASENSSSNSETQLNSDEARVVKVIDGDTIEVENGPNKVTIRYIGIDTPETVKPNTPVQCFGKEASNRNKELVENKVVVLEADVQERDVYGRLLRYVYLKNENGEKVMINKTLVEDGYASAVSFPPNVKYQEEFRDSEKIARETKRGLWDKCK